MKGIVLILIGVLTLAQTAKAQNSDFDVILSRGVADYEMGKYENALSWFKQAYKMDKTSDMACYELALTYLALRDDDKAAIYSSKLMDKDNEYCEDAYLINGSAWENIGRNEKARRIYKDGLKKFPNNYLLNYNLSLSFFNNKEFKEAQEYAVRAIELYPAHASSHLLLAYIMFDMGERVQSMLPLYYFLLIEQDSERSSTAYELLGALWNQGVRSKGQRDIQLVQSGFNYSDFATAELAVSLIKVNEKINQGELNKEAEIRNNLLVNFAKNNETLFKILEDASQDKSGFWWDFYVDFFTKIENNNLSEPFSYFISGCRYNDDVLLWMSDNHQEFQRFTSWMSVQ